MKPCVALACVVLLTACQGGSQAPDGGHPPTPSGSDAAPPAGDASNPGGMNGGPGGSGDAGATAAGGAAGSAAATSDGGTAGSAAATSDGGPAGSAGTTSDGGTAGAGGAPPTAGLHIVFPPPGAVPTATIVVRGTSTLGAQVAMIRVNGATATSSDGFATFRAVVPLTMGDNAISVTAESKTATVLAKAGVSVSRFADDASIHRGGGDAFSIFRTFGFAIDAAQANAIVCDDIFDGLVRIDLATGDRGLASASESSAKGMVGKGYNDISQPRDVTLDKPGHALLIDGGTLVGIDLASGDRALLSGPGIGSGPVAMLFGGVAYDGVGHRAVALDYQGNALFAVDPASGVRSILSSATVGTGQKFNGFGPVALDLVHGRALTTLAYFNPIIAIDLQTGNRSVLSGDNAGTGPAMQEPASLAMAPSAGVVFAWDRVAKRIMAVDLGSGNRRLVADATTGVGATLTTIDHVTFGSELLYGIGSGVLLAIDPVEGHRVAVSK
jgi:hypothetical protein